MLRVMAEQVVEGKLGHTKIRSEWTDQIAGNMICQTLCIYIYTFEVPDIYYYVYNMSYNNILLTYMLPCIYNFI